jgi:pyridoxamine 5'-phosphate oxidase
MAARKSARDRSTTEATRERRQRGGLSEAQAGDEPLALLAAWLDEAGRAGLVEPGAMALATADAAGRPSVRMVLLRGADERGLTFFSNRESRKGRELAANPSASVVLWWDALARQVRVEGRVELIADEESDAYFASRPRLNRLAAWASPQSRVIPDRPALDARLAEAEARFAAADVPRPPFWGGYRLVPETVEFWQGRDGRLHDRLRYARVAGGWRRERLAP